MLDPYKKRAEIACTGGQFLMGNAEANGAKDFVGSIRIME